MNVPFVGCSVDGCRGCNKLGQVCNFCCMDELAESTNNTSGMIHPLPCMIMWLKLTALIGLMGKLRLPIPHSLPTSHSFGFWVTPQIPLAWSLYRMTRHCQKSPNLSCPPQKFALLFEHIDSSARFITSCMSPHPIPGPLSFSYLCRPFQKYITCRRVQGGAPHLSLGP